MDFTLLNHLVTVNGWTLVRHSEIVYQYKNVNTGNMFTISVPIDTQISRDVIRQLENLTGLTLLQS